MKLSAIKNILECDSISIRNRIITARWLYYHTKGQSGKTKSQIVKSLYPSCIIVEFGTEWHLINIDAPVHKQSHFFVKFIVSEV